MKKTLLIASAFMTCAHALPSIGGQPSSSVLESLPAEVQKEIKDLRAGCREYLGADVNQTWVSPLANPVHSVSSGDEGLDVFTVSGAQAVMVNRLELCGGQCLRGANCSNRGSYQVAIYVRSGQSWRKALDTEAVGTVFLKTDGLEAPSAFKALVLNVFGGNKYCPTRDVLVREDGERYVFPARKQSCAAVVKWDGTKFTYVALLAALAGLSADASAAEMSIKYQGVWSSSDCDLPKKEPGEFPYLIVTIEGYHGHEEYCSLEKVKNVSPNSDSLVFLCSVEGDQEVRSEDWSLEETRTELWGWRLSEMNLWRKPLGNDVGERYRKCALSAEALAKD